MARFVIQLNETNGIQREDGFDYIPALITVALDIQELNNYVGMFGLSPEFQEDWNALPEPKPAWHPQEWDVFPRPIACNPEAVTWIEEAMVDEVITPAHWEGQIEKILGDLCTPPTSDGFVTVDVDNYEWVNFRFLIQMPTSFFLVGGVPKHVGKII